MFEKYFHLRVVVLYAAIIVGINCASHVRKHDIHDGDNRKALFHLVEDFILNMQQLRLRNLTVNEIRMKEDSRVKYNHTKTIKLPDNVNMVSTKIHGQCDLNNNLKIHIPLGSYKIKGSIQMNDNSSRKIYLFSLSLRNVEAKITILSAFTNIRQRTEIKIEYIHLQMQGINGSHIARRVSAIIRSQQIPSIKTQILEQLFTQINEDELLSYFSTMKNYCFYSYSKDLRTEHVYLINQKRVMSHQNIHNFSLDYIKIKDFYLNFTFTQDIDPETITFSFNADQLNAMASGRYIERRNIELENPQEFYFKLTQLQAYVVGESSPATRKIAVLPSTQIKLLDVSYNSRTTKWVRRYQQQLRRIIEEDLFSLIK